MAARDESNGRRKEVLAMATKGPLNIKSEVWREYEFGGRVYRIENPQQLWLGKTTHRVLDGEGITHCVPAPGCQGCVVRWKADPPVSF
jgi:hypothetical protein